MGIATEHIDQVLRRMLSQLGTDKFGGRDAPTVTVANGTIADSNGKLNGAINVHVRRSNGEEVLVHREPLNGVSDEDGIRDVLSRALSKTLAVHDTWPR